MVRIIADTLSCVSVDQARALNMPYLPQIIIFGEESYRDDTELTNDDFLQKLKNSSVLPKTAAPPPHLYNQFFQEAREKGESVIVVCPSADLSGTVRSAQVAAQDFSDVDIRVVDTRTIGSNLGAIVLKALEWANSGLDIDTIEKQIKDLSSFSRLYFMVNTLEYLRKGGRIGGAQALIGSILQVKPILMIKDGRVDQADKQRTYKRAFSKLVEIAVAESAAGAQGMMSIMHGGAMEEAQRLAGELQAALKSNAPVPIYNFPPAIMVHSGPGALAVSFFAPH